MPYGCSIFIWMCHIKVWRSCSLHVQNDVTCHKIFGPPFYVVPRTNFQWFTWSPCIKNGPPLARLMRHACTHGVFGLVRWGFLGRGGSSLVRQGSNPPFSLQQLTRWRVQAALKARNCSTLSKVQRLTNIYLLLNGCDQPKVGVASAKFFARFARALLLNPFFQFPGFAPAGLARTTTPRRFLCRRQ